MSRLKALSPEDMTAEQRGLHDAICNGPRGRFLEPFQGLLRSPAIGNRVQEIGAYLRYESKISTQLREMATLITVRHWNCLFEFHAHSKMAIAEGLSESIIESIGKSQRPQLENPGQEAVYAVATELLSGGKISDKTFELASGVFNEEELFELIATVGYYCMFAFNVNGYEFAAPPEAKFPE
jgi:4-carboxymuconolactone decarboxylase